MLLNLVKSDVENGICTQTITSVPATSFSSRMGVGIEEAVVEGGLWMG